MCDSARPAPFLTVAPVRQPSWGRAIPQGAGLLLLIPTLTYGTGSLTDLPSALLVSSSHPLPAQQHRHRQQSLVLAPRGPLLCRVGARAKARVL